MIKEKLQKNLAIALKKIGGDEKEINLEHPANPDFGDFATSIALKISGQVKKGNFLENIDWILKNVNKDNFESFRNFIPIGKIKSEIGKAIKSKQNIIYIKPRVYAKIKGWFTYLKGHQDFQEFFD